MWKTAQRNPDERATKLPFSIDGTMAKSNDASTWSTYAKACAVFSKGGYDGIGFMFSAEDQFCGIDLDGCRDPETGKVADWSKEIIREFNTYSEVSPSKTGVKMFCRAKLVEGMTGRKKELDFEKVCEGKMPAIEIYDKLRYFAVTGQRLGGVSPNTEDRNAEVASTCERFWPQADAPQRDFYSPQSVIERARKYVALIPGAVSQQGGHNTTFKVACALVIGFGLERDTASAILTEWNQTCQPPWSDRELQHKIDQAAKQPGERNYLRNAQPARWGSIQLPEYDAPQEKPRPQATTLTTAMTDYITSMLAGSGDLFSTGINELDYAIGGGLAKGELIVVAGRPSHGKSVIGLQCAHHWTEAMFPTLVITEEMSKLALGRRGLLYASDNPEEYWKTESESLLAEIEEYRSRRAECYIIESCQTMEVAREEIERHNAEHEVNHVIVDYAQLLQSKGKARWEQMANTSESLRRLVSSTGINILALVQMNQEIEKRPKFTPKMSDLGDTGQWSRDADVILFVVWPHRIDSALPANEYKIYVAKNRNRAINESVVTCRFEPSRQRVIEPPFEPSAEAAEQKLLPELF